MKLSIRTDEGVAKILDFVDMEVPSGKIVGIVGESGCGKSTILKSVLGILPRNAIVERGSILFDQTAILELDEKTLANTIRGSRIGFIPQDPYLALNPVFKVGKQLMEIMRWHRGRSNGSGQPKGSDSSDREHLIELLGKMQIPDPEAALERYPHQFSGGQRQRLLIAGALSCKPSLIVADEPTTALDVTTQREILDLLEQVVQDFGVSLLIVTHDLGVVTRICDEVVVMYAGQTVESGPTAVVLNEPLHPYTTALINCHPDRAVGLQGIAGTVPTLIDPPSGCRFRTRCSLARDACSTRPPELKQIKPRHRVNCLLTDSGATQPVSET
ncbi:ABC transporter ATP-binding protein [Comamonadaceae bacterium G21597-S1]|nr:ABC transporter ATP-binding protein [Comamonadaceae bacterium G21597-S1]